MSTRVDEKKGQRTLRETISYYCYGLLIALVAFMVTYQFVEPAPPKTLTIATGSVHGAYYQFARRYQELLARDKIKLVIRRTSGSVENLKLLHQGEVDAAFVQGGIGSPEKYPNLLGLGSLYYEPLWVFTTIKPEPTCLAKLAGKRIAIGPEGSGTRVVAQQLLAVNKIKPPDDELTRLGGMAAADALLAGRLDAVITVASLEAATVQKLLHAPGVKPMSFARASAYSMRYYFLSHVELPEGVVDLGADIPDHPVHLLAPTATLVVSQELHPALAGLLIQIAARVHTNDPFLHASGSGHKFPSPDFLDFPLHEEAERFYKYGPPFLQRYLPFWAAIIIDRLKIMLLPLLALFVPLTRILPLTYRWRMRSRIYRWYDELQLLDYDVHQETAGPEKVKASLAALDNIESEVRNISVPLSFASELYNLRQHIDMLRRHFQRLLGGRE
jgi:TRAP transporter TAXI family solute receptor